MWKGSGGGGGGESGQTEKGWEGEKMELKKGEEARAHAGQERLGDQGDGAALAVRDLGGFHVLAGVIGTCRNRGSPWARGQEAACEFIPRRKSRRQPLGMGIAHPIGHSGAAHKAARNLRQIRAKVLGVEPHNLLTSLGTQVPPGSV